MLYADFSSVLIKDSAKAELRGWAGLAIGSLAVAGIFAILIAVSRIPGIEKLGIWPLDFFQKGLIIHVIFSFVVWFMAVMGGLWHLATLKMANGAPRAEPLGRGGVAMGWLSMVFLFAPALMDRSEPSLNNYLPIIIDPLYYGGLATLGAGLLLSAVRLFLNIGRYPEKLDGFAWAGIGSAVIYILALVSFLNAFVLMPGAEVDEAYNEYLFWGGGHILQFANTTLLIAAWGILGALAFGKALVSDRVMKTAAILLLLFALIGPAFYTTYEALSFEQRQAFTDLQYGLGPSALLVALATLFGMVQAKGQNGLPWKEPAFLCLVLSALVFGLGGIFGFFVDGADTRTPSHYHAMIGGVGLAYMGLFYALFLPLLKRDLNRGRALYWQIYLYAFGQVLQCIGLYVAGSDGTARKAAGAEQGLTLIGKVGMGLNGLGGLTAVIGGAMFIWVCAAALLRKKQLEQPA